MVSNDDQLFDRLQRALTMVVRRSGVSRLHDRIARRAGVEIDRVAAVALSRLVDAEGIHLSDFAQLIGVDVSTASRHASHLEARGLARRQRHSDDARVVVVTATPEGCQVIGRLRAAHRAVLREALADWTLVDLESLAGLADRLADDLARYTEAMEATAR